VAVEAPLDEARSQAVIAQAKIQLPGKPITFIVNTHFHLDHGGGIRAYAAEGATLVVGEASRQRFLQVLLAPHTLVPDALQLNPLTPAIQTVSTTAPVILTGTTTRTLEVYPVATGHSADMVIAYLPQEQIVFVSDLFSPAGDFTAADLPADLAAAFNLFGLNVQRIAGGHGTIGTLLP
jgi:glyoxylase-like metal-dependent hydrolase (beta-lactamase superfamily II)